MRLTDPRNGKQLTIDIDLVQRWGKEFSDLSGQECDHERQELRRGTNRGGNPVIRMQCLDCGQRVGNPVKRPANADELPEINDTIHDDYNAARTAAKEKVDQKYVDIQLRRWKAVKSHFKMSQCSHAKVSHCSASKNPTGAYSGRGLRRLSGFCWPNTVSAFWGLAPLLAGLCKAV